MFRIIIYEWYKVFQKKIVWIIAWGCLIVNGMFCIYELKTENEDGYNLIELSEMYRKYEDTENRSQKLKNCLSQLSQRIYNGEITDEVEEYNMVRTIYEQAKQLEMYDEFLNNVQAESESKLKSSLFSKPDTFSYRNLKIIPKAYINLKDLNIKADFDGGVKLFTENRITDIFLAVVSMLLIMDIFIAERENGTWSLLKATKLGHTELLFAKIHTAFLLVIGLILIFYGTNYFIIRNMVGFGDVDRAIQSVDGYFTSTCLLSVGRYLVIFVIAKIIAVLSLGSVFILICVFMKNSILAVITGILIYALEYLLWTGISANSWLSPLQQCNAAALLNTEKYFSTYQNINFFSYPVSNGVCGFVTSVIFFILSLSGVYVLYNNENKMDLKKIEVFRWNHLPELLKIKRFFGGIWFYELYKMMVVNKGGIVLLLFIGIQILAVGNESYFIGDEEFYYREYSQILQGELSEEKEYYLKEEKSRIESAELEKSIILQKYYDNEIDDRYLQYYLEKEEISDSQKKAFDQAYNQYFELKERKVGEDDLEYVYQTPWNLLLGSDGIENGLISLAKAFSVMIIILASSGATEKSSCMDIAIAVSAAGKKKVLNRKLVICVTVSGIVFAGAFLPDIIKVSNAYGIYGMSAPVSSCVYLAGFSAFGTLGSLFVLKQIVRWFIIGGMSALVLLISEKSVDRVVTILASTVLFLIPVLTALLYK